MRPYHFVVVIGLLLMALVVLCWQADVARQRRWVRTTNLWTRGGAPLVLWARNVRGAQDNAPSPDGAPFVAWDKWPENARVQVTHDGLRLLTMMRVDSIEVASFVRGDDGDARWFYVVPADASEEPPWFRVVAMDNELLLYTPWPTGYEPIIEMRASHPAGPLDIIRRICAQREAGR